MWLVTCGPQKSWVCCFLGKETTDSLIISDFYLNLSISHLKGSMWLWLGLLLNFLLLFLFGFVNSSPRRVPRDCGWGWSWRYCNGQAPQWHGNQVEFANVMKPLMLLSTPWYSYPFHETDTPSWRRRACWVVPGTRTAIQVVSATSLRISTASAFAW